MGFSFVRTSWASRLVGFVQGRDCSRQLMTRSDLNPCERATLFSAHSWYGTMRGKLMCTSARYAYMQKAFAHFLHDCINLRAEPQLRSFRKALQRRIPQSADLLTVRKPMISTQIESSLANEPLIGDLAHSSTWAQISCLLLHIRSLPKLME